MDILLPSRLILSAIECYNTGTDPTGWTKREPPNYLLITRSLYFCSVSQSFYYLATCSIMPVKWIPDWMDPGRDPETMRLSRDQLMASRRHSCLSCLPMRPFPDGGGSSDANGLSMGVGIGECTSLRMTDDRHPHSRSGTPRGYPAHGIPNLISI